MSLANSSRKHPVIYALALVILLVLAASVGSLAPSNSWQRAGGINFALGLTLLTAFAASRLLAHIRIPWITGYILAGIALGPHGLAFLDRGMVADLKLIDDLAISFIGLMAGAHLQVKELRGREKVITLAVILQTALLFSAAAGCMYFFAGHFAYTAHLDETQIRVMALFAGVLAIARSPSSALAVISQCRARGPFTATVLGVTVVIDIVVIVLFGIVTTVAKIWLNPQAAADWSLVTMLVAGMGASLALGIALGSLIGLFIRKGGRDLALFLLAATFAVARGAAWLEEYAVGSFELSLHIEPLLICISAGFWVQNRTQTGQAFMTGLERFALPVFLLFFALAGASLNLAVLDAAWPLVLVIFFARLGGIFGATRLSGRILKEPEIHRKNAWMGHITQAGVTIGLVALLLRQVPEIGLVLAPIIMGAVVISEMVGPLALKTALERTGEAN
ncbi:MAG: cation:proton antiporter [Desulfatibacillaceae bacterium]|nr:cation:proton antiporter [Desulfatibacillaceae bacterium]